MRVLGIDPGMTGAAALLVNGRLEAVIDMPTLDGEVSGRLLAAHLTLARPEFIVIERVQPMPKNGSIGNFKLGMNYGVALGVAMSLLIPVVKLRPQEWKKQAGLIKQPKDASRRLAVELWPHLADQFARVKDDGRAEAALIARAGLALQIQEANA